MSKRIRCAITLWPYEISCVFTDNEFHVTKPPTNKEAFAKFKEESMILYKLFPKGSQQ